MDRNSRKTAFRNMRSTVFRRVVYLRGSPCLLSIEEWMLIADTWILASNTVDGGLGSVETIGKKNDFVDFWILKKRLKMLSSHNCPPVPYCPIIFISTLNCRHFTTWLWLWQVDFVGFKKGQYLAYEFPIQMYNPRRWPDLQIRVIDIFV